MNVLGNNPFGAFIFGTREAAPLLNSDVWIKPDQNSSHDTSKTIEDRQGDEEGRNADRDPANGNNADEIDESNLSLRNEIPPRDKYFNGTHGLSEPEC